jgi:hypothetical protein
MTSSFDGWTLGDIVGKLTKAEVMSALPIGWIRARDVRKWSTLESAVLSLSDVMKQRIHEAACVKARLIEDVQDTKRKRKRENQMWSRRLRRHLGEF